MLGYSLKKNVTIEKETGKIWRTGSQLLASVMGLETAATAIRSSNFQFTEGQAVGLPLEQFYTFSEERLHQLERIGTWCSWISIYIVNDQKHVWPQQHFSNLQWKFSPILSSLLMDGVTSERVPVISCNFLGQGSSGPNVHADPLVIWLKCSFCINYSWVRALFWIFNKFSGSVSSKALDLSLYKWNSIFTM